MPEKDSEYLVMILLIVFMILFSVIFPISAEKSQKHSSYQVIVYTMFPDLSFILISHYRFMGKQNIQDSILRLFA